MKFISTRGGSSVDCSAQAIVKGLADDGGLFVPETFPDLSNRISDMLSMDYAERASTVIGSYLQEYDQAKLLSACKSAYSRFTNDDGATLVKLDDNTYVLELFHGPTLAFKDVALTLLPYLLREGADITGLKEEILILVATSGDTGKAALEGFKNAKGIKICVFYPTGGVSDMQKRQMSTQEGDNVNVVSVKGNFDDCQTAVKKIFSDKAIQSLLKEKGVVFSSANSINFGRLVPQITYYFSAYCDLVNGNQIKLGDKVDFCVPTGNFGNILAGYYAKKMGLPIGKLVCASNENNVLTEFFETGTYDANREFYKTTSPSMDILISSNLERLVFELSDRNAELTKNRMNQLKNLGTYSVTEDEKKRLLTEFVAGYCDQQDCEETILDVFDEYGYVSDTHTAVALNVAFGYGVGNGGFKNPMVVLSTASPYKFPQSVYKSLTGKYVSDAFKSAEKLYQLTAEEIPEQILKLKEKPVRFEKVVDKNGILDSVKEFLGC